MKKQQKNKKNNYAFIDAQNVNLSIQDQWWKLDWVRFRVYLKDKYNVSKAYLFIWFIPGNQDMYTFFQKAWYILIFKPVLELKNWNTKWNVDAELVLQSMIEYNDFDQAVIVTWDWDFACLIKYFYENKKLKMLIVPNYKKYSVFLKQSAREKLDSISNLKYKLEYKKKSKVDKKSNKKRTAPIKH